MDLAKMVQRASWIGRAGRMAAYGTNRTCRPPRLMSAYGGRAEVRDAREATPPHATRTTAWRKRQDACVRLDHEH